MSSDPGPRLRALIDDWREKAKLFRATGGKKCPHWAAAMEMCAEHVEALLRASASAPLPEYVVPPTTAGGNETVVKEGIYTSRTPFSQLRATMSPESQARAAARTQEMLTEIEGGASASAVSPEPASPSAEAPRSPTDRRDV